MKILVVVPARGGSKGLPGKNIKQLGGKPLINYTIETARQLFSDSEICVSTDDESIVSCVKDIGLNVPFIRPEYLAGDNIGTREVLLHANEFYESKGVFFDYILLLQPTSPFRKVSDIQNIIHTMKNNKEADMVVSVKESKDNPYFNLFEEGNNGLLKKSKVSNFIRRQDCPSVFAYNGSIYLINIKSLKDKQLFEFEKVIKYIISDEMYNTDIDTMVDWIIAEYYLR